MRLFAGSCLLLLLSLFRMDASTQPKLSQLSVVQVAGTDEIVVRVKEAGAHAAEHLLEIDDAPEFRKPVATQTLHAPETTLHGNELGLVPGITYHLRLDGRKVETTLRIAAATVSDGRINCLALRNSWRQTGRFQLGRALSGLQWVEGNAANAEGHWEIYPHTYLLGESLYNAEMITRPAIAAARACGDRQTLEELASYYLIMLQQTETVGHILQRPHVTAETRSRFATSKPELRTFSATFGNEVGEGELYNTQWLQPAALLVRLVTLIPPAERSPTLQRFAKEYTQFIVKDQLERYLFQQRMPPMNNLAPVGRVGHWKQILAGATGKVPWDSAMSDIDLRLVASSAEMLGAHANDPELVPLDVDDLYILRTSMETGLRLLQSKQTMHPETKDWQGKTVGSVDYFEGDYAANPEMAFSGDQSENFPAAGDAKVAAHVGWDASHIYRLAVCLRALYENRKVLGPAAPKYHDLQLVTNQYVYRTFNGDYDHPLFHNYFDGSDGWFRVDLGSGFGTPPSRFCDTRNPKRPCLEAGEVQGWGQLAFANPDLERLQRALVRMAFAKGPEMHEFLERYYSSAGPYGSSQDAYTGLLYGIVAENADEVSGGGL